ncbi:hypothetical protein PIROE2DRAFT_70074 [Piromyces sp. E2]|nr:hypothetical protein PIROE2DRAFT_70074 [Piromyces sp. E2]|eukprot:OUM57434.1 hypothetical protein PIROE2DRAFT_70074 [Piromyces sp. E2]
MNLIQLQAIRKFSSAEGSKVKLSKNLWDELINNGARNLPGNADDNKEKIIISITFKSSSISFNNSNKNSLENVITEAYLNENEISTENEEDYICYISDAWYKNHLSISKNVDELCIEPTGLIELDEVYLNAKDEMSYVKAEENKDFILNYILKRKTIIKQNTILTIKNDNTQYSYDILMCLPVLQGSVNEKTKILLSNYKVNTIHFDSGKSQDNFNTESQKVSDDFNIIPENLLGLSTELNTLSSDNSLYFPISNSLDDEKDIITRINESSNLCLNAKMLTEKIPESLLEPKPEEGDDSDARIYVSVEALIKLQIFSGNWAYIKNSTSADAIRPVKVYTLDEINEADVLLSPILFHNLGFKPNNIMSEEYKNQITIFSLEGHCIPPVATEVTLSRVASPYTNEKRYLDHALNILKDSFTKTRKVVRLDDLIPVIVDDEKVKFNIKEEINNFSSRNHKLRLLFFKVTKVSSNNLPFGIFDQINTRLIQVGVSHSIIPSGLNSYYNIENYPRVAVDQEGSESSTIYNIISSSLLPEALEYNLSCNILLHGSRGVGKRTLIYSISEMLGINVYEKNCFELLAESETKTENALRLECNKVISATPCIFLLNNIHALTKKNQNDLNQGSKLISVFNDIITQFSDSHKKFKLPCFIIALTDDIEKLSTNIQSLFRYQFKINVKNIKVNFM